MINHYEKKGPWIWRCHVDLTKPNRELWNYLPPFIEKYDAVILTLEEYSLAREEVDATLVLLGNIATDDPEGEKVYQSLLDYRDERIIILSREDTALVNALQGGAAVVVQKSIREGFGLTVTEAMWKGTPVIGGNVGGIRYQIEDGVNGFLVSSVEEAAERMVQLVKDKELREGMGQKARETVKERFLMIRLLEQYLELLSSFETLYRLPKTWS